MQESRPSDPLRRSVDSVLAELANLPTHGRGRSFAIVAAMTGTIGWIDYLTGIRVSLELFYLVPIAVCVAWLDWRWGLVAATASTTIRVLGDMAVGPYSYPLTAFWNRLIDLSIYFVVVWVIHAFIKLRRELEQRVSQRTTALERAIADRDDLQKQLFEAGRRERSAIGHDLHDGLGQHLTATSMAANVLSSRLAAAGHRDADRAREVVDLLQEGIAKTRQIARGLLLSAIDPRELSGELEELAATLRREHPVACHFTLRGDVGDVGVATASHLFYIAQEAARNAIRHGQPARIEIDLAGDDRELALSVTDDGVGLPAPDPDAPGMGVRIMRHRSELIGGEFSIGVAAPRGTRVSCRIPLAQPRRGKP